MRIISVKEEPGYKERIIQYFQKHWTGAPPIIYEDCISHCITAEDDLPQWYVLADENDEFIGCAGLITNDFISRMDLYPWLCALFIEEKHRGNNYAKLLIDQAIRDTKRFGFHQLNLCTDHIGYYEKFEFKYVGQGYHPWGEESIIYQIKF